ncbi:MAG: hypothetical protein DRH24_07085 [Deltaproteobacteria bacterium]|nr:MAG: hypothetical protein DRH24_07085 [Deltaproteobacteria bacterium]
MEEQRRYQRFPLTLPSRVETISLDRKQVFELKTRNISASDVFIYTPQPFSQGTRFKIDLTIPSKKIKELTGAESLMECQGNIVRSTPTGVAVHFDRKCRILSLRGL